MRAQEGRLTGPYCAARGEGLGRCHKMDRKEIAMRIANRRERAEPRPFSVAHAVNVRISLEDFKADATLRLTVLKMQPPGKTYPTSVGFEPPGRYLVIPRAVVDPEIHLLRGRWGLQLRSDLS